MGVIFVKFVERHPTASNKIRVTFSENAINGDATTIGNYALTGGLTVSAAVQVTATTVYDLTLNTTPTPTTSYTLTVSNVRDSAGSTPITGPNGTFVFTWAGFGDNNLNGVAEVGGYPTQPVLKYIGDKPLGSNVDIATFLNLVKATWSPTSSILRITASETLQSIAPTFITTNYVITPPGGAPTPVCTGVSLGSNFVDISFNILPQAGTYLVTIATGTLRGASSGKFNLATALTWDAGTQRRRSFFMSGWY